MTETRVAVIGYGLSGSAFHAPFIAATAGLRLAAVVTGNAKRAALAVSRHPEITVLSTVDELWRRADEVDLVVVASPNRHHVEQAEAALAAGLGAVVDKPVAGEARSVRRLAETAERAGLLFTAFQNRRWDGDFRTVRALVEDGSLGRVDRFESRFERAAGPAKSGWKASPDPAELADVVHDLGSHLVDQAIVLFGPPRTVHAEVADPRPGVAVAEDATILLTHDGGVRSLLRVSKAAMPVGPRFALQGPHAGYRSWGLDPQEAASRAGRAPTEPGFGAYPRSRWGELVTPGGTRPVPTLDGDYLGFYRAVAANLRDGGPPPVPPAESVVLAETVEAVFRSAATGAPVAL